MFSIYHNAKRDSNDIRSHGLLKGERRPGAYLYPTCGKQWLVASPERGDLVHVVLDAEDPLESLKRMGVPEDIAACIKKRIAIIGDSVEHCDETVVFADAIRRKHLHKPLKMCDYYSYNGLSKFTKENVDTLKNFYVAYGDPLITTPSGLTLCVSTTLIVDGEGHGTNPLTFNTTGFNFTKRSIVIVEDLEHATSVLQRYCNNHGKRFIHSYSRTHCTNVDIYY